MTTRPPRPAEHLVFGLGGPIVVIDGRICALLDKLVGLSKIRAQVRGQNIELDQALMAIHLAGLASAESATGTYQAPQREPRITSELVDTVSTTVAAELLDITPRAVRRAITEKRLRATCLDGRWRISRDDLAALQRRKR